MNNFIPHPYQQDCINAVIERPGVALWLEMGLGKTVVTLTAIATLLQLGEVSKVLIVAPKKVAEATWQDEIKKWEHLQWLRTSTVLGTAQQRERALLKRADIYITNRDSVVWLATRYGRRWPFDMVVLDEASSFKHHSTQRFKALRKVRPFIHRVVELTGTPAPKDYMDLWAQVYLLDQGQRLGQRFTQYRDNYFQPDKRNGMQVYSWRPRKGAEEVIQAKLADIAISMQAATLTGKLLQLCNGAMYDAEKQVHQLNHCKLDAFMELIDALDGQKALVFYGFDFDRELLQSELKTRERSLRFAVLAGREEADAWNRGELDLLLAQPASCAYGLNLQAGGHHLIWYSLPWNLELYEQGNARLYRQGQQHPVIIHRLLVKNGADELVARALESKSACQQGLIQGIKALAEEARHPRNAPAEKGGGD